MKYIRITLSFFVASVLLLPLFSYAQIPGGSDTPTGGGGGFETYEPLVSLPLGPGGSNETPTELSTYLPAMFQFLIAISGVLAVVMIVIGGIQYMSTDAVYGKSAGKEKITQAIGGLILAIVAWLILYTINPNLLNTELGGPNTAAIEQQTQNDTPHTARVTYHVQNTYGPPITECKNTYPNMTSCQQNLSSVEALYPSPPFTNVSVSCVESCVPQPPLEYNLKVTYHVQDVPGPPKTNCYVYSSPLTCQLTLDIFEQNHPDWIIHSKICTTEQCVEQ